MRFNLGRWISKQVLQGPTGEFDAELDDERSQYPYDLNSGWWNYGASATNTSILLGVSSKWFKPETLIVNNENGIANFLVVYDGNQSRTAFHITVKASDTVVLGKEQLRGMFFQSGVFVSNLDSQLQVRIGGKLIASIQANV